MLHQCWLGPSVMFPQRPNTSRSIFTHAHAHTRARARHQSLQQALRLSQSNDLSLWIVTYHSELSYFHRRKHTNNDSLITANCKGLAASGCIVSRAPSTGTRPTLKRAEWVCNLHSHGRDSFPKVLTMRWTTDQYTQPLHREEISAPVPKAWVQTNANSKKGVNAI